jgi:D-glycero-D-manno-heptose 1,7-bisphosphate phosphatase
MTPEGMPPGAEGRAVFLDRDGTIIVLVEYLSDPEKTELLPEAAEAVRMFNEAGLKVIVVTNQSALARGYFTEDVLDAIHERMERLLEEQGARIDALYYCPHHPDEDCDCRKPRPGLLQMAAREKGIDLARSFMVGDRMIDVECGKAAGCKGIMVLTGYGAGELALRESWETMPDHITNDLLGAAEWIIKEMEEEG